MKFFKQASITLILIFLVQLLNGQSIKEKIDKEYYLLGTISDYMGRSMYKGMKPLVDMYYISDKSIALKLDSLFKGSYPDWKYESDNRGERIYSKQLCERINKYYIFEPTITYTRDGENILRGKLKSDIFKTKIQKLSFLAGAFARYGKIENSTYSIRLANSLSKAKMCEILLKEFNCSEVRYEIIKNTIPCGHNVYFKPSDELKEILR